MLIVHVRFSFLLKGLFLVLILFTLPEFEAKARDNFIDEKGVILPLVYDGFSVHVIVEGYGIFDVDAIYANDGLLYVNIEDLFKTLKIPCNVGQNEDLLGGFIETRTYFIDYNTGQIKVGAKIINAKNGLVKEKGAFYVESSLFAEAFGIILTFNFRALTIILKSNFELPIIKQLRIEKMRSNISKLKGEVIVDTIVQRNYHLLKFGTLDWSVASSQAGKGLNSNNIGLGIGTELLCGEADVSVNYSDQYKFDKRQLQYLWRWVDNDKSIIKQAQVGKISNQTISVINAPVIGAVIRNSPTTVRKATGYYAINEFTEPNWSVELYINNIMVDYTKADASGLYVFKVPIVYGYTTLKLKFYGPLGEERTEERTMNVPYTVMPAKEFEYGLSAGIVQDSSLSRFGKGEFNYGVNRMLTIGGGLEYLSSIPNNPFIPYAMVTIQPFSKMIINGEYAHGVKAGGVLNYYFRKDVLLEIDYTKYVEGQLATQFNADEERKVKLSIPFRFKKINGFAKLDYTQLVYKTSNYNQGTIMFSAYYKQISANSSTQLNWNDQKTPYVISDLSLSYRLKKGYNIRSYAQYNASESKLITCKAVIEKSIPKGNFSVSYERNVLSNDNLINLNFKYDLSFARTNISASHSNGNVFTSESAQGSLAFGGGNKYIHASNNSSVSKGGILLYAFLDLNNNGIFDKGEHLVKLNSVRVSGGKAIFSKKDSIVRIPDLNAFTSYNVEFSDNDLDNIAWRFKKKVYQVLIDPNQFKRIYIPIVAVGEVSGMAYMNTDNSLQGIGRILVKFYKKNSNKVVAETLSESDGYIDYMGFEPGEYVARVDSVQLRNLNFKVSPLQRDFTIKTVEQGDIVAGIDFVLTTNKIIEKPIEKTNVLNEKTNVSNDKGIVPNEKTFIPIKKTIVPNLKGLIYTIQLASSNYYIDPATYKKRLNLTDDVWCFERDGVFNYVTGKYINEEEAMADMVQLGITGFITAVDPLIEKATPNKKVIDPNKKAKVPIEKANVPIENAIVPIEKPIAPKEKTSAPKEKAIVSNEKGVIFTIQLAASKTYIDPAYYKKKFKLTDDVWYFEKDGYFKYVTGKYLTKKEATAGMVQLGIPGFVTVVDLSKVTETPIEKEIIPIEKAIVPNEKEIVPIEKAIVPIEKEIVPIEKGMIYTIQLAASKTYIDPATYKKKFKLTDDVWYFEKDGYFKYVTGKYLTKKEATAGMVQLGIPGFVTVVDQSKVKETPNEKTTVPNPTN